MNNTNALLSDQSNAFKKANELMEWISDEIENISIVTIEDVNVFNRFFKHEALLGKETHGNGFSYLIQMMNSIGRDGTPLLGYKFYDGEDLIPIVVYPRKDNEKEFSLYMIRPLGKSVMEKVIKLALKLSDIGFNYPIYVKKIYNEQREYLLGNGFLDIGVLPWHKSAYSEDDTFPEIILSPERTLKSIENGRKSLRSASRMLFKLQKENAVEITDVNFEKVAWQITQDFFRKTMPQLGKVNMSSERDYYNIIFNNSNSKNLLRKLIYINGKPEGFYIGESYSSKSPINLYALISLRNYSNTNDYLIMDILKNNKGRLINLGGSEDVGINNFKIKFNPIKKNQMHWVVKLA